MKNKFLLGLLLVPFMFVATACGDDDGDGGDETPVEENAVVGTWTLTPAAGTLAVGPNDGDYSWWTSDAAVVTDRACFFDDTWTFESSEPGAANGTFTIDQGAETWLEQWQNGTDQEFCGAGVAPFTGGTFDWAYDETAGTLTVSGSAPGAYLGLPKANNDGEISTGTAPTSSVTYTVNSLTSSALEIKIQAGGAWWRFRLSKQ